MRKISADYIFPISSPPIKNGIITIDDDGLILNVEPEIENSNRIAIGSEIEYFKGIICPGFINTHCHLELSHLHSRIAENTGITGFIKEITSKRFNFSEDQIQQCIVAAEKEMVQNGIVAVGDISNNNSTFNQKAKRNLLYHTFIEVFDLTPDKAEEVFNKGLSLQQELSLCVIPTSLARETEPFQSSIVPHAPYTVSEKLLKLINTNASGTNTILSIHNQESETENEFFFSQSGRMFEMFKKMGINPDLLRQTGGNSLRSTLPFLMNTTKLLLVHNTFTSHEDIRWAEKHIPQLFWCTCPNANMYIENKLPNYNYFIEENARVTIGTDSLASNWSLSVLDELKTIVKQYPEIPLQTLLVWATKNGADLLGFTQLGTIEKGKKPGLNLLKNMNNLKLSEETEIEKLI